MASASVKAPVARDWASLCSRLGRPNGSSSPCWSCDEGGIGARSLSSTRAEALPTVWVGKLPARSSSAARTSSDGVPETASIRHMRS
jgi:hypothetical protein